MSRTTFFLILTLSACTAKPATAPTPKTSERELLAFAPPSGTPAIDQEILAGQKHVRDLPKKADYWVLLGRAWVKKARQSGDPGYYLNADACASAALELEPQHRPAQNLRGLVLLNSHRFPEAKALAEAILAEDSDDAMALGTLSDADLELGDLEGATRAADKMLEKKPDLPSYSRASYLRWLRGDAKGAIEAMRLAFDAGRGQKDKEPSAWTLVQAANMFWAQGDLEGAEAGYDLTLQYLPGYAPALVGKGRVLMAKGQAGEASKRFREALEKMPLVETAWLLGDACEQNGDTAGAMSAWATVKRLGQQGDPRTFALFLATKNQDIALAVKLAKEELDKRPGPPSRDAYAFALFRAGKMAEAAKEMQPVLALGIKDPAIRWHAGMIAIGSGDISRGKELLRQALSLNPHFDATGADEARRSL
ncbi:MAG: tetratricopeptide repeat protein [Myxococcota bacterium]